MKTKNVKPTKEHMALRDALVDAMKKHGSAMQAYEILAVFCHIVGQLIAMQDQRKYSPETIMELVAQNIERGNKDFLDTFLSSHVQRRG